MKTIILSIKLLIGSTNLFSQDYLFSHFNEAYVEFSDGTVINNDSLSEFDIVEFPIGFDFPYFSYSFDSIFAHYIFLFTQKSISSNLNETLANCNPP